MQTFYDKENLLKKKQNLNQIFGSDMGSLALVHIFHSALHVICDV